jgi:signal peptidase I
MDFDMGTILLVLTLVFGVIWVLDRLFFYNRRMAKAAAAGKEPVDPIPVDWARSLFPVILIVLVLRSFVAEPFRIPSGSMMPTLDVGDFILVNKFSYGLRLPGFNTKAVAIGEPRRGDVVVFRFPGYICQVDGAIVRSGDQSCEDPTQKVPNQNWIKRVIGLPGDHIESRGSELYVNGQRVLNDPTGPFTGNPGRVEDRKMLDYGATLWTEHLPGSPGQPGVDHTIALMPQFSIPHDLPNGDVAATVPKGCYIVMGDNRYNSTDSRWWGCMPEQNLVGKAFMVWLSWKGWNTGFVDLTRIGKIIH